MDDVRRFKYYGKTDLTTRHDLPRAEARLKQLVKNADIDGLNDAFEVYNSVAAFKDLMPSLTCSDEEGLEVANLIPLAERSIGKFFGTLTEDELLQMTSSFDMEYREDFFVVTQKYNLLDKISEDGLEKFLDAARIPIWATMRSKAAVEKFPMLIKKLFLARTANIEMLLDNYVDGREQKISLPDCISTSELGRMATKYIRSTVANPKYLQLLANPTPEIAKCIGLPPAVQVEAKKRSKQIIDELIERGQGMRVSNGFAIATTRRGLLDYNQKNPNDIVLLVDKEWVSNNLDFPTLLNNLWHLYGLFNDDLISALPSFPNFEMSTMEKEFQMEAIGSYRHGNWFEIKNNLMRAQLHIFDQILQKHSRSIEKTLRWFFANYSPAEYNIKWKMRSLSFSHTNTPIANKNVILFTIEESLRKQYSLICEHGEVDTDILNQMPTPAIRDLPSFSIDKYAYPTEKAAEVGRLLFSDQSSLAYINSGEAGHSLYDLVLRGEVPTALLKNYQKAPTDFLVKKGILTADNGVVRLINPDLAEVYKRFYELGVIGIEHAPEPWKPIIKELARRGEVRTGSSLFAEPESDYLSYILNNRFAQSLGLRNSYEHGIPCYEDEQQYTNDYYTILLILVLYVIKINDELAPQKYKKGGDVPYCEFVPGF